MLHCEYNSVWTKIYLHRSGPSPDICQQTSVGVGYTHARQEINSPGLWSVNDFWKYIVINKAKRISDPGPVVGIDTFSVDLVTAGSLMDHSLPKLLGMKCRDSTDRRCNIKRIAVQLKLVIKSHTPWAEMNFVYEYRFTVFLLA